MALTMTRTRTQTALAKLVEVLARVNGELAFVRELMAEAAGASRGLAGAGGPAGKGARGPVHHDSAVRPGARP